MRMVYHSIVLFVLLGLTSPSLQAADPENDQTLVIVDVVDWLGAEQQQMRQAKVLQAILDQLPIPFTTQQITRNRARMLVQSHSHACMPWLLKTAARQQHFLFSKPYMLENALRLVVNQNSELASLLTQQQRLGNISLQELLTTRRPPLLGIATNRSYGAKADTLLKELHNSSAVYTRTSSPESTAELLPMLQRGFIDVMMEYEVVLQDHSETLLFFPFQETERYQLSYFACSNTEVMATLMPMVNQAIATVSQDPEFQQLMSLSVQDSQREQALKFLLDEIKQP